MTGTDSTSWGWFSHFTGSFTYRPMLEIQTSPQSKTQWASSPEVLRLVRIHNGSGPQGASRGHCRPLEDPSVMLRVQLHQSFILTSENLWTMFNPQWVSGFIHIMSTEETWSQCNADSWGLFSGKHWTSQMHFRRFISRSCGFHLFKQRNFVCIFTDMNKFLLFFLFLNSFSILNSKWFPISWDQYVGHIHRETGPDSRESVNGDRTEIWTRCDWTHLRASVGCVQSAPKEKLNLPVYMLDGFLNLFPFIQFYCGCL